MTQLEKTNVNWMNQRSNMTMMSGGSQQRSKVASAYTEDSEPMRPQMNYSDSQADGDSFAHDTQEQFF